MTTKLNARGTMEFTYEDDDGEEVTAMLPGKYEVCGECSGHGRHTDRNIDGNGISSEEWAQWDEEERETYLTGGYDVLCEECGGEKVVAVVDEETMERNNPELLRIYRGKLEADADVHREKRMRERGYEF